MEHIKTDIYHSPCGDLLLGSFEGKLCLCDWTAEGRRDFVLRRLTERLRADCEEGTSDIITETEKQLDEYFNRSRTVFDIPLLLVGTDFQETVWHALLEIHYGETASYAAIARRIGADKSVRAVANANRANAVSIIVPCHRVIGSDGTLTGYGGGLDTKRYLLELENGGTLWP